MLNFGRSPCGGALLPNGSLFAGGFVQALGTSRLHGSIPVSPWHQRCRRLLISPRLQPARYVFAMGFPRPVTRIVVPPLETRAACRVRLAATTLQTCEIFAEYRIRLSLPYILRSTPLLGATEGKHAGFQSESYEKLLMSRWGKSLRSQIDTTCSVPFARR